MNQITEKEFLAQVKQIAIMLGWDFYHPFLSKWSTKGFPDIVMVKDKSDGSARLIFAELKTSKGKLTADQEQWISRLSRINTVEVYVWRPEDFDEIVKILRK